MGNHLMEAMSRLLPLTEGDDGCGKPVYRTNPQTGCRYSFEELTKKATDIQMKYQVSNPYLAQESPSVYA